jgi:hypothetical protein
VNLTITTDTGTGNIVDDDQPTVAIADGAPNPQTEADAATITFDVTLSNAADQEVTVDFTTVNGTAVAGVDYVIESGTLTFGPGDTSETVTVTVLNDEIVEDPEAFTVVVSNAQYAAGTGDEVNLTITTATGTGNIVDDDVTVFPSGLAYTVAGSKTVDGEQLYSVDLQTGETVRIGEVLIDGDPLGPNSTSGMSLNPEDGYLYAVGKDGGDSWLLKINPVTAETEVIDSKAIENSFAKASAATFDADGTFYVAFGNVVYEYDLGNPRDPNSLDELFTADPNVSADAIAVNHEGSEMFLSVGDTLWKYDFVADTVTEFGNIEDSVGTGYTLDGLSYDDNGTLWGLDNGGNILRIDTLTAEATNVTTLAVNEVTGAGVDSLAISVVDPGTYVVLTDGVDTDTTYLPETDPPAPLIDIDPEDDGWDLSYNEVNTNVILNSDGDGTVTVTQDGTTSVESVYVQSDNQTDITVSNFEDVEVQVRGEGPSTVTVNDATTVMIDSGESDDVINLGDVTGGTFTVTTDGGFDIVTIDSDLDLGDGTLSLNDADALDITGTGINELTISYEDVLGATDDDDILEIYGDVGDTVSLETGAGTWVEGLDDGSATVYEFQVGGIPEVTVIIENAIDVINPDTFL